MPIQGRLIEDDNGTLVIEIKEEEELGEDFRRIRSHVMNEVEEEKEEKYKQLEFEFEDYNISDDQVAPI